ncbi:MAG: hypothetical protein Kow006_15020 [Gammaproteobacteria bacterium]
MTSMASRIDDIPVFAARPDRIDAPLYNLWRRARKHLHPPLRLQLPDLKEMALIVEDQAWVVVDQNRADVPVLAWVDFQDKGRDALHEPVPCTLNYYHFMASHLRAKVLECLEGALEKAIADARR